jgi:hypothetical protein
LLLAALQFGKHARVDRFLRIEEALEIEGIGHGAGSLHVGRPSSHPSWYHNDRHFRWTIVEWLQEWQRVEGK